MSSHCKGAGKGAGLRGETPAALRVRGEWSDAVSARYGCEMGARKEAEGVRRRRGKEKRV